MNKEIRTFFISGHRDITREEFAVNYQPAIIKAIENYDAYFIVGDYQGVDIMAQNFLVDTLQYDPKRIIVCHMNPTPMFCNAKITNWVSNMPNDYARDIYMSTHSDADIAFIRKGKEMSYTAQNILRRYTMQ